MLWLLCCVRALRVLFVVVAWRVCLLSHILLLQPKMKFLSKISFLFYSSPLRRHTGNWIISPRQSRQRMPRASVSLICRSHSRTALFHQRRGGRHLGKTKHHRNEICKWLEAWSIQVQNERNKQTNKIAKHFVAVVIWWCLSLKQMKGSVLAEWAWTWYLFGCVSMTWNVVTFQ